MNVGERRVLGEVEGLTTNMYIYSMYTVFLKVSSNGSSFTVDCVNICVPGVLNGDIQSII